MNFLLVSFFSGILCSFTPCVYPMIPITLGILQAQASKSILRNFFLSLSYVLGIALVYSILGYIAATTRILFGQWVNSPFVITFVIILFLYLAFSMFGYYEIYIPNFLTKHKDINVHGSIVYSFIFGLISGTVASPCLTPALAIILTFVAKQANPVMGFLSLFFFSLGMGLLLIIIGTFSASIYLLPKSGEWMIEIKKIFGFLLLAVSIYFSKIYFTEITQFKLYAILALIMGIYYFATAKHNKIKIIIGLFLLIVSIFLLSRTVSKSVKLACSFKLTQKLAYLESK